MDENDKLYVPRNGEMVRVLEIHPDTSLGAGNFEAGETGKACDPVPGHSGLLGWVALSIDGNPGNYLWCRVAPVASEQASKWEPKDGEPCVGIGAQTGVERKGEFRKFDAWRGVRVAHIGGWVVTASSLRPAQDASGSARDDVPDIECICCTAGCQHCDKSTTTTSRDPYAAHRAKLSAQLDIHEGGLLDGAAAAATAQIQLKRLERMTRAERIRAQALLDFDRPVPKPTAHPSNWPSSWSNPGSESDP